MVDPWRQTLQIFLLINKGFFQAFWYVVGPTTIRMVQRFMDEGFLDERINVTNLCLILKKHKPEKLSEFRPISLCNTAYKIISKVLSKRLKRILPEIVFKNHATFIKGKLISDNILMAHEEIHALRIRELVSSDFIVIKIDMIKAYDRLEWAFLEKAMRYLGFFEAWINRIMKCVSTVSYGVMINGQAYGQINPSRGIRYVDLLSPLLFIICTEALIGALNKAEKEGKLQGIQVANQAPAISNLLFTDDSLFFYQGRSGELGIFDGNSSRIQKNFRA